MNNLTYIDIISLISSIAIVVITGILVYITREYKNETKLIRLANQKPVFSLVPTTYSLGGRFYNLTLVNIGQTATQIYLDCKYGDKDEHKKFFILSLNRNGSAFLDKVHIAKIIEEKLVFTVTINCKDSKNEPYQTTLSFDFNDILKDNRTIAYQYSEIGNINETLNEIRKEIKQENIHLQKLTYSSKPNFIIQFKQITNPLKIGQTQNIVINLKDPITTESIIDANINFKLITPGGSEYTKESISDENGKIVISYGIDKISEIGRYKLVILAAHTNYRLNLKVSEFDVIEN